MHQSTMTLGVSWYGTHHHSGVPAYDNNAGIRTVGGFLVPNPEDADVKGWYGGYVFCDPTKPHEHYVDPDGATHSTGHKCLGILMNRYATNEQNPTHVDYLLQNQPTAVIYHGAVWIMVRDADGKEDKTTFATYKVGDTITKENLKMVVKEIDSDNGLLLVMLDQ